MASTTSNYDFPERVFCNQAVNWSNDYRLSMCTESCIKILCLNQEPSNTDIRIKMRQSFIPAEKDVFDIPRYNVKQHRELQWKLSRDDLNSLIIDKIMSPYKFAQDLLSMTGFRAAVWSPLGADQLGRCVLATLSFDSRLLIFSQGITEYKWTKIADLTEIRLKATEPSPNYKTSEMFHAYKEWCYSQALSAISWCPTKFTDDSDGSNYSLLAAGTVSGHVVFWKVKIPCLTESDCSVLSTNQDHQNKVISMVWSETSGVLAVSHYHGNLTVGQVNKEFGTIKWTVLDTSEDFMKVSCMCFCKTDKDQEDILIVNKEQYIYGFHIRIEEDKKITLLSKTFAYGPRQMYATGICQSDAQSCIITSLEGGMEIVKANIQTTGLQLEVSSFNDRQFTDQPGRYNGVTISPNKIFCAYVHRPPQGYDHLDEEWKRSTKLVIRTLDHSSQDTTYNILINYSGPLIEIRDFMERYRQFLISNPDQSSKIEGKMSRRKLTLLRFTILSKISQIKNKTVIKMGNKISFDDKTQDLRDELVNVSYQMFGLHIEKFVNCAIKPERLKQSDFSLLSQFLQFIEENPDILQEVLDVGSLQSLIKDTLKDNVKSTQHYCPICTTSMTIQQLSWQCENGHKFGLCCHTLRPCIEIDYRSCISCNTASLSFNDLKEFPWLLDVSLCVFCESFML